MTAEEIQLCDVTEANSREYFQKEEGVVGHVESCGKIE